MASIVEKVKDYALEKVDKIQKPSCDLTHLGFKDVTRKHMTMASTLSVKNPYDHDLPIVSVTYKLSTGDREMGNGSLSDAGGIKGNDTTKLELPTTVEYDFLWNLLKDIGSDGDIDYTLDVGVIFQLPIIGKHTIPLKHSGTISIPILDSIL